MYNLEKHIPLVMVKSRNVALLVNVYKKDYTGDERSYMINWWYAIRLSAVLKILNLVEPKPCKKALCSPAKK